MKLLPLAVCLSMGLFAFASTSAAQPKAQVFTVDSTADTPDADPGDGGCADAGGQCTLRAAIDEANSIAATRDVIIFALPNPSVIELTQGELLITENAAIVGPGARRLTIERSSSVGVGAFRIFHIANSFPQVDIRGMKIRNGDAGDQDGGGILVDHGNAVLTDLAISENKAVSGGGIANTGVFTMSRCLVNSNAASSNGGGIYVSTTSGGSQVLDSTITDNAALNGGGIHTSSGSLLVNDTIAANMATTDAQSIFAAGSDPVFVRVLNTIIGNDPASSVTSLSGAFFSFGNNIVTDARGSTSFINGVNGDQVSDNNAIDAKLGPLANNDGPTDTKALLDGSPALNTGNGCVVFGSICPSGRIRIRTDQRGLSRISNLGVDIGAYEASNSASNGVAILGISAGGKPMMGRFAVVINPATNQRTYRPLNPFGGLTITLSSGAVYVLQIIDKRSAPAFGPLIISGNDSPPFSLANKESGITITFEDDKDSGKKIKNN
ncbi:MAG: choice-of-anchor Q domain-containing protein [Acidobacteriota bacterium]